jgi:hypothetical protein
MYNKELIIKTLLIIFVLILATITVIVVTDNIINEDNFDYWEDLTTITTNKTVVLI